MTPLTIKYLASGGVMTNYHCVSCCDHCLYNCSPQRAKDYLDGAQADKIFQRVADLGCRSVHIGGGEPMLAPQKLTTVLTAAAKAGVEIEYVETNSTWYVDCDQAKAVLNDLRAAGVNALLISISPFHNAHIPFSRVRGVIDACRRTGMGMIPWVNAFIGDLERMGEDRTHALAEFEAVFGSHYLENIPDRYWIHLGGRALETFRAVYPSHPPEKILEEGPRSCARVLSDTSHFHIDLYGNYIPGLCTGLSISMDDLGRPLSAGKYPLIDQLATAGIRGLFDLAGQTFGYRPRRRAYLNHCDLCTDIRQFLAPLKTKQFAELSPQGFYAELPPVD